MDSLKLSPRDPEIASCGRSNRDDNRVVLLLKPLRRDVPPDLAVRHESYSLRLEHLAPSVYKRLVELEAGYAVAEKPADVRAALVHRHRPATAAKRDCGGKSGGTCADYRHLLAVLLRGRMRHDPAVIEGGFDDALLRLSHHDGLFVELVYTRSLAQSWADARGEFWEVGVLAKEVVGAFPVALRDRAVLVGNEVPERAAVCMAEGLAAVHAARGLFLQFVVGKGPLDFVPVAFALLGRAIDVVYSLHDNPCLSSEEISKSHANVLKGSVFYIFCNLRRECR